MESLAQIFGEIIKGLYEITGDYGVAIVLITIGIRCCLVPFNIKQRKMMKKQKEISRQVEALKAKYGRNQEKLNRELQKLYQEQGTGMGSCILPFLQLPIMLGLYNAIRMISVAGATTILLPWVGSILMKDRLFILPILTVLIQLLPQIYPYLHFFKALDLQKTSGSTICFLLLSNSIFAFMIPSGVGLYYLVSGVFVAVEQFVVNLLEVREKRNTCVA